MSGYGAAMRGALPRGDVLLASFVVAIIAMMVVPLPTALIDLSIALNLAFGITLLTAALYMRDALRFTAFPTLLLLGTLYRLSLNVASTRLILLQADAGRVIEAFGSFVVRGDYRVGALVFVMLTLVQFLVIARGAERVAEVGARFSLDALPGKQLAIDAELRAGTLSTPRARDERRRLERESQLYGALDGALKFVKGDAIAGIVITLINFVGGVSIGVFARELPLQDSLRTYGLLTIGDGLVTQLPALLSATAAGLVVTRVAPRDEHDSLLSDMARTLVSEPRALAIVGAVSVALAFVPALPAWPFACVALGAAALAFTSSRAQRNVGYEAELMLELGPHLHDVLRQGHSSPLADAIARARRDLQDQLGLTLPPHDARANSALAPLAFRWSLRSLPDRTSVVASADVAPLAIVTQLEHLIRRRAPELLSIEAVQQMVDRLEREQPALVRLSIPRPLSVTMLAQVLRLLVAEGVSVRWLSEVVEAVAPSATEHADARTLAELARRALAQQISHALAPDGSLHVLRVSPDLEEALRDGLSGQGAEQTLVLPGDLAAEVVDSIADAARTADHPHALVTTSTLRRHVRALVAERLPELAVVSPHELTPSLHLTRSALIGP